jgi:hypothetical protein
MFRFMPIGSCSRLATGRADGAIGAPEKADCSKLGFAGAAEGR